MRLKCTIRDWINENCGADDAPENLEFEKLRVAARAIGMAMAELAGEVVYQCGTRYGVQLLDAYRDGFNSIDTGITITSEYRGSGSTGTHTKQ